MKKKILWWILGACLLFSGAASADNSVRGHIRKDGSYVAPHYRTNPDSTRSNNYSIEGNVNPHNGNVGTKPLYDSGSLYKAPRINR